MPSENPVPRFSHIAAVVVGTALPALYAGDFFCADPLHSKVIAARRLPLGSSFKTADRLDAVMSAEEAFRPVFLANSPDGLLDDLSDQQIRDLFQFLKRSQPITQ